MTTMTDNEDARREFLGRFLGKLDAATMHNTDIELDIYLTIERYAYTELGSFERGFYDETMDIVEIADALL